MVHEEPLSYNRVSTDRKQQPTLACDRLISHHLFRRQAHIGGALFNQLSALISELDQVRPKMDNTRMVAGAESYAAALNVYRFAKDANADEALGPYLDHLARRFFRKSMKAPADVEEGDGG